MGTGVMRFATVFACVFAVGAAGMTVTSAPATAANPRTAAVEAGRSAAPAGCARRSGVGVARCYLTVQPAPAPKRVVDNAAAAPCPVNEAAGYTPCNLQNAYGLKRFSSQNGIGNTVAVVDPLDDPNAEADLKVFRKTYGLPGCTTANGCFKKFNQDGVQGNYPTPDANDAGEIALDIEMVSAICPKCHIDLVEANSASLGDLGAAENEAVALGAKVVSNSWGTGEFAGETGWDGDFDHPGVAITFSSGDGAYQGGVQYPSASPYVTSVGGTELTPATNTRGWTETAWVTPGNNPPTQGSGSGCSAQEPKPSWQHDAGCAMRTTADVSAVAANVLSYNTYQSGGNWFYSFGTSVSSPIIAAIYGLANNSPSITAPASAAYTAAASTRRDIVSGQTGTCTPTYLCKAAKGYDGPTGMGSPHGIGAFVVSGPPPPTVSGVSFTGSPSDPTVTVSGSNFGTLPPIGSPESCNAGDTGDDYGSSGLSFNDANGGWTAGQAGDCIGLVLVSWADGQVVYQFGNQYPNYQAVAAGDQVTVQVQGAGFTGTLTN